MPPDNSYDEKELLQRVAQGDRSAFTHLFDAWHEKLYFFTLKFTRSSQLSEDMVQDVFVKIWLQREQLNEISNFSGWIYRVIRNQAISGLRKIALETTILAEIKKDTKQITHPVDEVLLQKQLQQLLNDAINQLPPRQKQIYTLTRIEGMKQEEVAEMLNISISTVQNHMTEALKKIRSVLNENFSTITVFAISTSLLSL